MILTSHSETEQDVGRLPDGRPVHRTCLHLRPIAHAGRRIEGRLGASGDPLLPLGCDELLQVRCRGRLGSDHAGYHIGHAGSGAFVSLLGCNPVEPVVTGGEAYYAGAYNGADLRLTLGGHRLNKDILLRDGHPRLFRFRLRSTRDFDPEALTIGRLRVLPPSLERDGSDPVGLSWDVEDTPRGYVLTAALPPGNWAGWTLDPTTTLQPGAADGIDTFLYGKASLVNYNSGINATLRVGRDTDSNTFRTLIRFDASQFSGRSIVSGSLVMPYPYQSGAIVPSNVSVYRALTDWPEGTLIAGIEPAGVSGATWAYRDYNTAARLNWGAAGGQAGVDRAVTATATTASGSQTSITWVVTSDFSAWAAGTANYGWHILADDETTPGTYRAWYSSDDVQSIRRPYVVVEHTDPPATFAPWLVRRGGILGGGLS